MEAPTRVIDMHNHIAAPEVVEFLQREGKHFDTEIVERDGARFFRIGPSATRPIHERICHAEARLPDMDAGGIDVQAVSGSRSTAACSRSWSRASARSAW